MALDLTTLHLLLLQPHAPSLIGNAELDAELLLDP